MILRTITTTYTKGRLYEVYEQEKRKITRRRSEIVSMRFSLLLGRRAKQCFEKVKFLPPFPTRFDNSSRNEALAIIITKSVSINLIVKLVGDVITLNDVSIEKF